MKHGLEINIVEDWQTVSCNSCTRHNIEDSIINKEKYTDKMLYELQARGQVTVLCEDCLRALQGMVNNTLNS